MRGGIFSDRDSALDSEPLSVGLSKVNRFQRYLARRAWGWLYTIWAAEIAFTLGTAALVTDWVRTYPLVALVGWVAVTVGVPALALWSSAWVFREASRMAQARDLVGSPKKSTLLLPIPVRFIVILLVVFVVAEAILGRDLRYLEFGGALVLWVWFAKVQSETLGKIQPEGRWAIGAHLIAASTTIGLVLAQLGAVAPWVWVPVAAIGAIAGFYGIHHAEDEFAADSA